MYALKTMMRLLHPFTPFVTEAIWGNLCEKKMLIEESWPKVEARLIFKEAATEMEMIHQIIMGIRKIRAEYEVEPVEKIKAVIYGKKHSVLIHAKREPIIRLARLSELEIHESGSKIQNAASHFIGKSVDIYIPLEGLINKEQESIRLKKEIQNLENYANGLEKKLSNKGFTVNAPQNIIKTERTKHDEARERLKKLRKQLQEL